MMQEKRKTSWNHVGDWYGKKVGQKGHFYHQSSILPELVEYIRRNNVVSLLDLACGQGVLERTLSIPRYVGVDIASTLVNQAKQQRKNDGSVFVVSDVSKSLPMEKVQFDAVTCVLALQNIENYRGFFDNVEQYCKVGGFVAIVLNHPYFRIPRFSGWDITKGNGKQVRWVSNYASEQKIPITMNPGSKEKQTITWSFHVPLSTYINELSARGFVVEHMDELSSPKESVGKYAKRENTARAEIPLFMLLVARKIR